MHLLFASFDFTIVFCFAWDDYVASFCNSPFFIFVQEIPLLIRMIDREASRRGRPGTFKNAQILSGW